MNDTDRPGDSQRLDFTSLEKALASLGRAIDRARAAPEDEELRDAVIQRFEYSFELSWKMLKRQMEREAAVPSEIDGWSFKTLLREAAEKGLVEFDPWMVYREQRNITAHTYDAAKARSVYKTAVAFLPAARTLLQGLEARNHD